jgi:FolB domain-containing protein
MGLIRIEDLEVCFHVGVPDGERSQPQRLLICLEMAHDFSAAAKSDDLEGTIDYYAVSKRVIEMGKQREWRLIEALASDVADMILKEFKPESVAVEVKKMILPETRYVSVKVLKPGETAG